MINIKIDSNEIHNCIFYSLRCNILYLQFEYNSNISNININPNSIIHINENIFILKNIIKYKLIKKNNDLYILLSMEIKINMEKDGLFFKEKEINNIIKYKLTKLNGSKFILNLIAKEKSNVFDLLDFKNEDCLILNKQYIKIIGYDRSGYILNSNGNELNKILSLFVEVPYHE